MSASPVKHRYLREAWERALEEVLLGGVVERSRPECGSQIYATSTGDGPKVLSLRAGALNQRDLLKPRIQIWRRSALPWLGEIDSIPARETQ